MVKNLSIINIVIPLISQLLLIIAFQNHFASVCSDPPANDIICYSITLNSEDIPFPFIIHET